LADRSATVNAPIINAGSGEIILVIDAANSIRPNLNPAAALTIASTANLSSGGPVRIFAVNPANTHLGGFTPAARRYNVWFGDALTVAGVNYKFQPTLTLTADSFSKTYGQTVTFDGDEFTVGGLQPGDSLSQILSGNVGLSSLGSAPTAGVAGQSVSCHFQRWPDDKLRLWAATGKWLVERDAGAVESAGVEPVENLREHRSLSMARSLARLG
jgi:hypothetical protein